MNDPVRWGMPFRNNALFAKKDRPWLIWALPVPLALYALFYLLVTAVIALSTLEPDGGSSSLNGFPLTPAQVLFRVTPSIVVPCLALLFLAAGLTKERTWARPLAVLFVPGFVALSLLLIPSEALALRTPGQLDSSVVTMIGAYLYFHMKPNVRAYYEELAKGRASREETPVSAGSPSRHEGVPTGV